MQLVRLPGSEAQCAIAILQASITSQQKAVISFCCYMQP